MSDIQNPNPISYFLPALVPRRNLTFVHHLHDLFPSHLRHAFPVLSLLRLLLDAHQLPRETEVCDPHLAVPTHKDVSCKASIERKQQQTNRGKQRDESRQGGQISRCAVEAAVIGPAPEPHQQPPASPRIPRSIDTGRRSMYAYTREKEGEPPRPMKRSFR